MARAPDEVPFVHKAPLAASAAMLRVAEAEVEKARKRLASQLARTQTEGGYSIRALAEATELSVKRVRLLLREGAG